MFAMYEQMVKRPNPMRAFVGRIRESVRKQLGLRTCIVELEDGHLTVGTVVLRKSEANPGITGTLVPRTILAVDLTTGTPVEYWGWVKDIGLTKDELANMYATLHA